MEDFGYEEGDIILPETIWGEIVYIFYILRDIIKNPVNIKRKLFELERQMKFFIRYINVKD